MSPQNTVENAAKTDEQGRHDFAKRLAELYFAPLMSYFRRRVHNEAEAEDLTQDVLLRVIGRAKPEEIDNAEAFLFRTAANLLRDRARRHRTRVINYSELVERHKAIEVLSPERVVQARQSLQTVWSALEDLGERTRDIFLLHRLENMKYREIADLYGVSQSAVEKHMIKALAYIAKHMEIGRAHV